MRLPGFLLLILSACQASPEAAAPPERPLRDFRGIIHCHSKYSHDSQGTYEEILAAAKAAKIDFICMTDHPPKGDPGLSLREGWTGIHDGVLFIRGAEFGEQILGLGLKEPIRGKDRRGKIREIHQQGGVAIACHPEMIVDWDEYEEADGMEVYNVHATLQRKAKDKAFLLQIPKVMKEKPEKCFQLLQELDPAILKKYDEISSKRAFAGIAGNDAHQNVSFFGFQLDPYPRAFKFVTTHVLAEELTQDAILDAVRAGRCYVAFEVDHRVPAGGYVPTMQLKANKPSEEYETGVGPWGEETCVGQVVSIGPDRQRVEWWTVSAFRRPYVLFNPALGSPPRSGIDSPKPMK